jgi:hypothetical protein
MMRVCQLDIFSLFSHSYHTLVETINERRGQATATFFDLIAPQFNDSSLRGVVYEC